MPEDAHLPCCSARKTASASSAGPRRVCTSAWISTSMVQPSRNGGNRSRQMRVALRSSRSAPSPNASAHRQSSRPRRHRAFRPRDRRRVPRNTSTRRRRVRRRRARRIDASSFSRSQAARPRVRPVSNSQGTTSTTRMRFGSAAMIRTALPVAIRLMTVLASATSRAAGSVNAVDDRIGLAPF